MAITVVGLGPGSADLLTREAWQVLTASQRVYFRTLTHPSIKHLPVDIEQISFDYIYNRSNSFEEVFADIVSELLTLGKVDDVVYAVPGHPFIAESSVTLLVKAAEAENVPIRVVAGLSFVELCLTAVQVDGIEGLQLFDAIELEQQYYPVVNPEYPLLVGQVHCNMLAGELITVLCRVYPEEHPVYLIHWAGNADEEVEKLPLDEIDLSEKICHLTTLYIPPVAQVSTLAGLAETVATILSPEAEVFSHDLQEISQQNVLATQLAEFSQASEATLKAIKLQDHDAIFQALSELMKQVVIQTEVSAQQGGFELKDLLARADEKLKSQYSELWEDDFPAKD
ncbi:MAG: hypothetical protein HRT37_15865 [Alteromonadaceae bacterium]|nr:hypothetical protein [Alteromonadaceae bacterium]